jgi:hypothetical protein
VCLYRIGKSTLAGILQGYYVGFGSQPTVGGIGKD